MSRALDQVDALQKQILALQPIPKERQQVIDKKFRLEFNYNSNHMEGNTLTYGETELLLIFEDTKGNHSIREYDEMRNHDVAYKLIEEWAADRERSLTEQNIKNLNEIILVRPFWKEAITPDGQLTRRLIKIGNYKEHPNSVRLQNGEMFHYTSPTDTPIEMANLMEWYRLEEKNLHPVTLATMLHYKLVRIHPFDDGNGRVARLLMNYVLLRNEFPPVIIKSKDKTNYLLALRSADVGDYESLIEYVAEQLIWSQQIIIKGSRGEKIDEIGDFEKRLRFLKSRLNTDMDSQVRVIKSKESIIAAWDLAIFPLFQKLELTLSKLSVLFKSTTREINAVTTSHIWAQMNQLTQVKSKLASADYIPNRLDFNYNFAELRKSEKLNVSVRVFVLFHANVYEVRSEAVSLPLTKLYDESFSSDEVEFITESIGDVLAREIEKFLDENQPGKA